MINKKNAALKRIASLLKCDGCPNCGGQDIDRFISHEPAGGVGKFKNPKFRLDCKDCVLSWVVCLPCQTLKELEEVRAFFIDQIKKEVSHENRTSAENHHFQSRHGSKSAGNS
jgi:hypothetical protein